MAKEREQVLEADRLKFKMKADLDLSHGIRWQDLHFTSVYRKNIQEWGKDGQDGHMQVRKKANADSGLGWDGPGHGEGDGFTGYLKHKDPMALIIGEEQQPAVKGSS